MIETKKLYCAYGDEEKHFVIEDLNLSIKKGSFTAILGHNGSGKSTLAKHFNAILLPESGKVYVNSMDTADEEMIYKIRQEAGMVFQNPDNQIVAAIVEDEVAFAPENMGVEPSEIRKRVNECLKIVNMTEFREAAPSRLSGGQKQRIAIAAVLAMEPECIILDEPTAMLDPMGRKEVIKTIKLLNKNKGMTVVLITHFMEEAAEADRVIVLDKGKVVMDDVPKRVFSDIEGIKSTGLDVPQVTELVQYLREQGIELPEDIITVDECVEKMILMLGK
ncbi:MAG: energy-coupling factor transporter ATPase [Eubacteriales bacterium]|nr:energy-coupling factor transporter ATPase [Eubacteriales bacterium]